MSAPDPTGFITAGYATGFALVATWLHRQGYRPPCQIIRTPPGLLVLGVFLLHLGRLLGRWDPINYLSRKIPVKERT